MDPKDIIIEQVNEFSQEVLKAITTFAPKFGHNYQPFTEDSLHEIINSSNSYVFIARYKPTDQIVGMIMEIVYKTFYTKKAYVDELFVDEQFRKMSIGTKLMNAVMENAEKHHALFIEFTSKPTRIEGNALYIKMGFQKYDTNVYRKYLKNNET